MLNVTVEQDAALQPALAQHAHFAGLSANKGEARLSPPLLRALGDGLDFPPFLDAWTGTPDMGVVFFLNPPRCPVTITAEPRTLAPLLLVQAGIPRF